MEDHRVDVALVAGELAHFRSIRSFPEPNDAVISAARDELAIRARCDGTNPAIMRLHDADGLRRVRSSEPPDQRVIVTRGNDMFTGKGEVADPGFMTGERDAFVPGSQFPSVEIAVF